MATPGGSTAIVSPEEQVLLPEAIRERRDWPAGTRLQVEDRPEGVLLRTVAAIPVTRPDDVFGCVRSRGKPKSLAEMEAAIRAEARRRHAGD